MSESDAPDCPLCMETFELDDMNFFPCTCGYQICRFCWHRIRTVGNGLCPACRKTYSEDPAEYQPLSQDELQKIRKERKQREVQHKQKISDNRQHLSNIRVIQKHLVFVVGLSNKMADAEVLKRSEYFGKFGKILKIVVNPNTNYAGPQGPSASAYITYAKEEEALRAILSINNMQPPLKIRASLGTTKYCTHYLRNTQCPKPDCMYLHDVGDMNASFTKDDMQAGKHQIFEKNLLDNYMVSVQRKQKQSVASDSTVDTADGEIWDEDDMTASSNNSNPSLPSKTSWAVLKEDNKETDAVITTPAQLSSEYPGLQPQNKDGQRSKRNSESSSGHADSVNHRKESSHKKSDSHEWSNASEEKTNTTRQHQRQHSAQKQRHKEEEDQIKEPQKHTTSTTNSPQKQQQPPPQQQQQLRQEDVAITTPTTQTITTTTTSNNLPWPSINDLGLSDLQINSNDDDLGFDPFNESKNALEDMMATERQQGLSSTSTAPKPSFHWDSFLPSYSGNPGLMTSSLNSYSLFGAVPSLSTSQVRPAHTSFNSPYDLSARNPLNNALGLRNVDGSVSNNAGNMQQNPFYPNQQQQQQFFQLQQQATSFPTQDNTSFLPTQQQQAQASNPSFLNNFPSSYNMSTIHYQQQQQQYMARQQQQPQQPVIPLSTTVTSPTSTTTTVTSHNTTSNDKKWLDGLRALLPNVHISFGAQANEPPPTGTKPTESPASPISVASPPPGFSSMTSFQTDGQPTWLASADKSSSQRVLAPPPGFYKPPTTDTSTYPTTCATVTSSISSTVSPTVGLLSVSNSNNNTSHGNSTADKNTGNIQQHPQSNANNRNNNNNSTTNRNSQVFPSAANQAVNSKKSAASHDDPSILWSKVLSDKANKDIETTSLAFPLPGETIDQALSNPPLLNQQQVSTQQQMMSWNSVVSGSQYGSGNSKVRETNDSIPGIGSVQIATKPLEIIAKDTVKDSNNPQTLAAQKSQKPSPIFGSQQKHGVKKPTAHVKPLKCTAQSDGFTTVYNSRQYNSTIGLSGGSRVSELDDFSADLLPIIPNVNVTANVVSNFVDYQSAVAQQSSTVSNSATKSAKKKKKKGAKDQQQASQVPSDVGSNNVGIHSNIPLDEERPKKGGKKKKKTLPSQDEKYKEQQQQQQPQIRILKSDGNSGSAPLSPTQAVAGNLNSPTSLSMQSSQHDQEIVTRLTESTEKLLKNVLFETEAIKLNTEQISKDLKSALEKCKESSLSLSDLEKINLLLTPGKSGVNYADDADLVDTTDLERQVESAHREAKMLEARLNDVIRKNMASELETLKRNTNQ